MNARPLAFSLIATLAVGCLPGSVAGGSPDQSLKGTTSGGFSKDGCSCSKSCCSLSSDPSSTAEAGAVACGDTSTCYGGYFCDLSTSKCVAKDPCDGRGGDWTCASDSTTASSTSGGAAASDTTTGSGSGTTGGSTGTTAGSTGTTGNSASTSGASGTTSGATPPAAIGPSGGQLAQLTFGLIGDTRPPTSDDVSAYPSSIVTNAYKNMGALSSPPAFAIASGDFMFSDDSSNPSASTASQQAQLYMSAIQSAGFTNQVYLAIGNHECNTATTSNCGAGNADGETPNYTAFLSMLSQSGLGPTPYYTANINSSAGVTPAWTSKFVVIACNAWDSAQESWLKSAMAAPTTYTFVVRHETVEEDQEPGVPASPCGMASSAILAPYANQGQITLLLAGHTHYFKINNHPTNVVTGGAPGVTLNVPEIVAGNGGAPLRADATDYGADGYGYVVCDQTPDANPDAVPDIACQEYDATSGAPSAAAGALIQVSASGALISGGGPT